jgi:predicted component of type VI protein secretion system
MAAYLVPIDPGACVIPLEKAVILVGRQSDCDVSLTVSRKISRKHCCIAIVNDTVMVRDLGSTNGCSINGNRIEREGRLRMGDQLSIGDVRFRLQSAATNGGSVSSEAPKRSAAAGMGVVQPASPLPPPLERSSGDRGLLPRGVVPPPPMSMEFPVALADDGHNFLVEASQIVSDRSVSTAGRTATDSGPLVPMSDSDELPQLKLS